MVTSGARIAFFGTPAFALPTLDVLLASSHHVVAVVTQPDRPRGRGQQTTDGPVKARAVAAGLPVLQPDRLSVPAFLEAFRAVHVDLGVVAAYGKILPGRLLELPRLGMINVHASLLPKYRGAAPVHRAIVAGEPETGVTIMRVVQALDAGPMLASAVRPVGPDETSDEVESDLARIGARLLSATIDDVLAGTAKEIPQDDAAATYAPRLTKEDGAIEWTATSRQIHNQIRGLLPWPHAYAFLGGSRIILHRSELPDELARVEQREAAGTVVHADDDRFIVRTGDGTIRLLELQPEGKRRMLAREFLSGHHLATGSRFTAAR